VHARPIQVILTGDDFGRSATINAAVMEAHHHGVLTSTSLMVAGAAVEEAVALARATPSLAVGLHLVVMDGPAVLPPAEIPHLVDGNGQLPNDPFGLGVRYGFSREAREELKREMAAQFAAFEATGLPLSHVDGHQHMHLHPTVLDLLLPLAAQYGARGVRLPRDDLWLGLRHDRRHAGTKIEWTIVFGLLNRRARSRLTGYGLVAPGRVYGLMQTGHMDEAYVVKVFQQLRAGSAELYFHPNTVPGTEELGPNPGDLSTLLSPAVRQVMRELGLEAVTYAKLAGVEAT
jgi:hopanoid biosynthesis associated protein HpnK